MKVLVGIVSKNRASLLPKAINSALAQKGVDLGVSVYDDNSTDQTFTLAKEFPGVSWEFGKNDEGYVFARNKFMRNTGAQYFCSLDDDAWFLEEDSLKKGIDYLEANSDVGAIAFDILSPDHSERGAEGEPVETNMFIGCGHILRLEMVSQVGFYERNPSFYGGEEKDICIRLLDKGCRIVRLNGVHVWHDKSTIARDLKAQHRSGVCNDLVFTYRRTPGSYLIGGLLLKMAKHFWFSLRYANGKVLGAGVRGIFDFLKLLFTGGIKRNPVSKAAFTKFVSFNS